MRGQEGKDFYTIELGREATPEQIQNLINKIEDVKD